MVPLGHYSGCIFRTLICSDGPKLACITQTQIQNHHANASFKSSLWDILPGFKTPFLDSLDWSELWNAWALCSLFRRCSSSACAAMIYVTARVRLRGKLSRPHKMMSFQLSSLPGLFTASLWWRNRWEWHRWRPRRSSCCHTFCYVKEVWGNSRQFVLITTSQRAEQIYWVLTPLHTSTLSLPLDWE